jgi:transcriptional regulator with XRE-family HTH domain
VKKLERVDDLAARLRMERARIDKKQDEVANAIGITASMLCNYENGNSIPTLQKLALLADYYGCSLDYLAGRKEAI